MHSDASSPGTHFDVIVVGGGPAGSLTSRGAALEGLRTLLLVDPRDRATRRSGEMLASSGVEHLRRLGLRDRLASTRLECEGALSCWGSPAPARRWGLESITGPSWHVDRASFDDSLRRAAGEAGAELRKAYAYRAMRESAGRVSIEAVDHDGRRSRIDAPIVVDAAGPSAPIARSLGARRIEISRLATLVVERAGAPRDVNSRYVAVEAVPNGWWYSTVEPDGRLVVCRFGDVDDVERSTPARLQGFESALQGAPLTRSRLGSLAYGAPTIRIASEAITCPIAAPGWITVGDAAAAFDPLSSRGLVRALVGAESAVASILATYAGDRSAIDAYARDVEIDFLRYLETRARYYAMESRFADRPFWRRRAATPVETQHISAHRH